MKAGTRLIAGAMLALLVSVAVAIVSGRGEAAAQTAPSNQTPPTISGTAEVGKTLTASNGTWTGTTPLKFAYSWRRCDTDGGSCAAISGATEKTYVLKSVDAGNTIRVRVTASNNDGAANATSVPTAVVKAAPAPPPANDCAGAAPLQVSKIGAPKRLNIDGQQISPPVVGRSTTTLTVRFHVSCEGKSVQGAMVYVTAVPYNPSNIPAEQATGADGWAQLSMGRLRGYPASNQQQLLVMFVRARKPGDPLLGGISTRRLVSFPVNLRT